ncbi:MAG: hypothetical protein ACREDV_10755 [Methylocella sp.]
MSQRSLANVVNVLVDGGTMGEPFASASNTYSAQRSRLPKPARR